MPDRLADAGLRATRARKALAALLFNGNTRYVTAEQLHRQSTATTKLSLATVYNTLKTFTKHGLLQEVVVDAGRSFFDINVTDHHHFYCEDKHALIDIPVDVGILLRLSDCPRDAAIRRVDLIIRIRSDKESTDDTAAKHGSDLSMTDTSGNSAGGLARQQRNTAMEASLSQLQR
jgi:Fur family iron response transcriptional regulator